MANQRQIVEPTRENADRIAQGKLKVVRWGRPIRKLSKKEMLEYEGAKERGYIVTRHDGLRAAELSNAYYRWCEADPPIPWIRVTKRRVYATISMDLINVGKLHPHAEAEARALFLYATKPPSFLGMGGTYWCCERVRKEEAELIAARLWAIATAPRPEK